MSAIKTLPV